MEQYSQEMTAHYELNDDGAALKSWKVNSKSPPVEVSEDDDNDNSGGFDCNICLDSLEDPVVTFCGHMYCWPCIYKWIHSQTVSSEKPHHQEPQCPVCKAKISEKTLIPLYGRGQSKKSSDRMTADLGMDVPKRHQDVPKRPQGPRCTDSHPAQQRSQLHQQYYAYPGGYMASPVLGPGGTGMDLSQPMIGMFGEPVYARMFGNSQATLYTYPNSYNLAGTTSRRMRRRMMAVDRSLSRICFFLFCCMVLCLLLF